MEAWVRRSRQVGKTVTQGVRVLEISCLEESRETTLDERSHRATTPQPSSPALPSSLHQPCSPWGKVEHGMSLSQFLIQSRHVSVDPTQRPRAQLLTRPSTSLTSPVTPPSWRCISSPCALPPLRPYPPPAPLPHLPTSLPERVGRGGDKPPPSQPLRRTIRPWPWGGGGRGEPRGACGVPS